LFLKALEEELRFGPSRRVPIARRLFLRAWWRSSRARKDAMSAARVAVEFAAELGLKVVTRTLADEEAVAAVKDRYRQLDEAVARRLVSFGCYLQK